MANNDTIQELIAENRWLHYREQDKVIHTSDGVAVTIRTITRVIKGLPIEHKDAIKAALNSTAEYTTPQVDGRALTGTWKHGGLECRDETLGGDQTSTFNIYHTIFSGDYEYDEYVSEDDCRYQVSITLHLGRATPPTLETPGDGVAHRIVYRDYDSDFGGHLYVVEKRVRKYQDTGEYDSEISAGRTGKTRVQTGITSDDESEVPSIGTAEDGKIKRQTISKNADCSRDVTTETTESVEQDGVVNRATILSESLGAIKRSTREPDEYAQPTEEGVTRTYRKTPNIDGSFDTEIIDDESPVLPTERKLLSVTEQASEASGSRNVRPDNLEGEADASQGVTVQYSKVRNPDGTYDEENQLDTSPILDRHEEEVSAKRTVTGDGVENARGTEPQRQKDPTVGTKVRFTRRLNPDGTYTYFESEETINESSGGLVYELTTCRDLSSGEIENNILADLNEYTPDDDRPNEPGVTVVVRLTENDDGTWNKSIERRTAPKTTGVRVTKGKDVDVVITTTRGDDDAKTVADLEGSYGEVESTENADCSYDNVIVNEVPVFQWYTRVYISNEYTTSITVFKNAEKAYVDGLINNNNKNIVVSPSISINQYGLFNGSVHLVDKGIRYAGSGEGTPRDYSYPVTINGTTYTVSVVFGRGGALTGTLKTHVSESDPINDDFAYITERVGIKNVGRGYYRAVKINATS